MLLKFKMKNEKLGLETNWINFIAFLISELHNYDLDYVGIYIGLARTGKSTFALDNIRRIYCYENDKTYKEATSDLCINGFLDNQTIYDKNQDIGEMYKKWYNKDIWIDEGYLVGDKREIVKSQENKIIHAMNVYANHNNRTHILIQNYQHIDFRLRDKSLLDYYFMKRGTVYTFCEMKTSLVQNQDHFDTENQERWIFSDPKKFVRYLLSREGFIKKLTPKKLDIEKDPLYYLYMGWKEERQGKMEV